jgi:site-specific DNA recombinase
MVKLLLSMANVSSAPDQNGWQFLYLRLYRVKTGKRAQQTKKKNSRESRRNRKHNYLFGGYVTCGHCGLSLSGKAVKSGAKTYLHYYCNGHRRETVRTCSSPKYRADIVDSEVWQWIRDVMSDPAELRKELENRRAEREKENEPLRDRLIVIRDLVSEHRSQMERLLDLFLSGEFQKDMLVDRKTRYEKIISSLERERNRLMAELESNTLTSEQLQTINEFASDVEQAFAVLDENDFDEKRAMIYRLGVQVRLSVEDDEKVARASSVVLGESPDLSVDSITTGS